jgi:hypothetical protein
MAGHDVSLVDWIAIPARCKTFPHPHSNPCYLWTDFSTSGLNQSILSYYLSWSAWRVVQRQRDARVGRLCYSSKAYWPEVSTLYRQNASRGLDKAFHAEVRDNDKDEGDDCI